MTVQRELANRESKEDKKLLRMMPASLSMKTLNI
jgi:hypothetical protein